MKQNKFGEMIFSQLDLCDLIMQGKPIDFLNGITVDESVHLDQLGQAPVYPVPNLRQQCDLDLTVEEFHAMQQSNWHMPDEYKNLDIAEYILSSCDTQEQLQRCGQELLLYQERDLFDLLKFLKYLVDVMRKNNIIWGVGRGSSVASYVLYKLGVHRIDSMYYNLDIQEFLR